MLKYLFVLSAVISSIALAAAKKSEIVECQHVTVIKVETDENGKKSYAIVHPHALRCQPQKAPEPEVVPTKVPRLFPKQP